MYLLMTFQNVSWYILKANVFFSMCIFSWRFRMYLETSCRQRAFLLCVSSRDISECLLVHPWGKWLFFCVYLLVMFQKISSHILQAKGFFPLCIFPWLFKISRRTSCRHRDFILCVSSNDVSEWIVPLPAGKGLLSCVSLHDISDWQISCPTSHRQKAFLLCVSSHDVKRMSLDTPCTQRAFLPCVSSLFRMSRCTSHPARKGLFSSHILQAKGFSPVFFSWHFKELVASILFWASFLSTTVMLNIHFSSIAIWFFKQ